MYMIETPLADDIVAAALGNAGVTLTTAQLVAVQQSLCLFQVDLRENVLWGIVKQLTGTPANADVQNAIVAYFADYGITTPIFIF